MRDFFEILNKEGVYNVELHNKSEGTYQLWGNLVEFISVDQPQKVRGRKREILFINEANELSLEDWRQLMLRTTERTIIDFNPSDEFHWIYDQVIPREDADFFQTTYKDNSFRKVWSWKSNASKTSMKTSGESTDLENEGHHKRPSSPIGKK
jgi:phage terminase large subunit